MTFLTRALSQVESLGAEALMNGDGPTRDLIEQLTQRLEALSPSVKPLAEAKLEGRWSLIYASRGTVRCSLPSPEWPFGSPHPACV